MTTDAVSTAEKDVVNESDGNAETLYISDKLVTPEKDQEADSDGMAETVVVAGNKDASGTAENEALPDYYFDFLNDISLPERSSEFDDSRNLNMTFAFTSDAEEDIQVSKMSHSKDTESDDTVVIKRKKQ